MNEQERKNKWSAQRMRAVWKINDKIRDAGLEYPEDVLWAEDILYGPYGLNNLLDIYYPAEALAEADEVDAAAFPVIGKAGVRMQKKPTGKLPVIFDIHGGGWHYGDKELYRHYNIALAQMGFAVVGFNYRLAPEDLFPAAFTDVNRAMNWVAVNADKYGLDADRVFILGDSAGGQMASWYCTLMTSQSFRNVYTELFPLAGEGDTIAFTMEEYMRDTGGDPFVVERWQGIPEENMKPDEEYAFEVPFDKIHVRACALNCGIYDMAHELEGPEKDEAFGRFLGGLFTERREDTLRLVDAWSHMDGSYPPAFVMSASHDFLLRCAAPMAEHLKEVGAECELHIYGTPEQTHMQHVFHVNQKLAEAPVCNKEECEFFRRYL